MRSKASAVVRLIPSELMSLDGGIQKNESSVCGRVELQSVWSVVRENGFCS